MLSPLFLSHGTPAILDVAQHSTQRLTVLR